MKRIVVAERLVADTTEENLWSRQGDLNVEVDVRTRFYREGGRKIPRGDFLVLVVGDEMLAIPARCIREALGERNPNDMEVRDAATLC